MNKLILNIVILLLANLTISAQSLYPLRNEIIDKYSLKMGVPIRIAETIKNYKNSGVESKKEFFDFSENGDTITISRYENGDLKMLHVSVYNGNQFKIADNLKRKINDKGWINLTTTYTYNEKGLSEVRKTQNVDYKNLTIITTAIIECDSLGNLIDSKLYDSNKTLTIHETGEYNYEENRWIYKVFDPNEQLQRKEVLEIIPTKEYNDLGDVILYPKNIKQNNKTYYRIEYKYDEFENWINKKVYQFEQEGENKINEKLFETINRKIEYKNNAPQQQNTRKPGVSVLLTGK